MRIICFCVTIQEVVKSFYLSALKRRDKGHCHSREGGNLRWFMTEWLRFCFYWFFYFPLILSGIYGKSQKRGPGGFGLKKFNSSHFEIFLPILNRSYLIFIILTFLCHLSFPALVFPFSPLSCHSHLPCHSLFGGLNAPDNNARGFNASRLNPLFLTTTLSLQIIYQERETYYYCALANASKSYRQKVSPKGISNWKLKF